MCTYLELPSRNTLRSPPAGEEETCTSLQDRVMKAERQEQAPASAEPVGMLAPPSAPESPLSAATPAPTCFICLDDRPEKLVRNSCACRSLSVHTDCLEAYVNHSSTARHKSLQDRMHCSICKEPYTLPYVTAVEVLEATPVWKTLLTSRLALIGLWLILGAALAAGCYWLEVADRHRTSWATLRVVIIVVLCVYFTLTSVGYVYCLAKAEMQSSRARADPRQIRFSANEDSQTAPRSWRRGRSLRVGSTTPEVPTHASAVGPHMTTV